MKTNVKKKLPEVRTCGGVGSVTQRSTPEKALRRSVLTCMLWEDLAYEDGQKVAERIAELVPQVKPEIVAELAVEAREKQKLRHIPLFLVKEMVKHPRHKVFVATTIQRVVQRADELGELISLYWEDNKKPLPAQIKKGLAAAFHNFNEYSLSKYANIGSIKLRDVMFLVHPKPENKDEELLWKKLANNQLSPVDTWETAISATKGVGKKEEWERLLKENKLGALALIRNLRNFEENNVDTHLVKRALEKCNVEKVLPFRFVAAAKYAPRWENELENLMFKCLNDQPKLKGKTVFCIDVSGSMSAGISGKSEMSRVDAAAALCMLIREVCEEPVIYATAGSDCSRIHSTALLPPRRGFALREAIRQAMSRLGGGGIFLKQCSDFIAEKEKTADRFIVLCDSQDTSGDDSPKRTIPFGKTNYLFDVSCHEHGIAYNKFLQINGFSEHVLDYIREVEASDCLQ